MMFVSARTFIERHQADKSISELGRGRISSLSAHTFLYRLICLVLFHSRKIKDDSAFFLCSPARFVSCSLAYVVFSMILRDLLRDIYIGRAYRWNFTHKDISESRFVDVLHVLHDGRNCWIGWSPDTYREISICYEHLSLFLCLLDIFDCTSKYYVHW